MTQNVLIIDDEVKLRNLLTRILCLEGVEVTEAGTYKEGLQSVQKHCFDVVFCDVKLPDGNGVDMVTEIKKKHPDTEVILLTAYGNIKDGVQAMKNGAFDYITKGDDNDKIIPLLHRALEKIALKQRVQQLEKQIIHQYTFENILGESLAIKRAGPWDNVYCCVATLSTSLRRFLYKKL